MQIQKDKSRYKIVKTTLRHYEEIPEEWEIVSFGDICERITYGFTNPMPDTYDGPWMITATNIKNGRIDYMTARQTNWKSYKELLSDKSRPKIGTVLITKDGTLGEVAVVDKENLCINQSVASLEPKKSKITSEFLSIILQSQLIKKLIEVFSPATTIKHISITDLAKWKLGLPPTDEQQKIASIFSDVDNLIDSYDKAIEKTTHLKKGLMNQLLTKGIGHKKFKKIKFLFDKMREFPQEWDVLHFQDVIKFKSGSTPSRSQPEYFSGDIPWVTSTDLNREIVTHTLEKITEDAIQKTRLKILPKGTVLIALYGLEAAGTRGKCCVLGIDATINQACMALLPSERLDPNFLFYFYLAFGEKIALNVAQGTKQQNLSEDVLETVKIPIPLIPEQQKIASILSTVDSKIKELESKKLHLEKLKKGLMQKLLTGQIRVKT